MFSNTFFVQFNSEIKQHISGNTIETKFVPTYACIYKDKIETNFLKMQEVQSPVWLRYIDVIFFIYFIWTHGEAQLWKIMKELNKFLPKLKFAWVIEKKRVTFLDIASLENVSITSDLHTKSRDCHQYLHCSILHPYYIKN